MNATDWATLMDALRILSPALGGWAIYLLRQLQREMRSLTTDVQATKSWQSNHDRLDEERFHNLQRQVDIQQERLGLARRSH